MPPYRALVVLGLVLAPTLQAQTSRADSLRARHASVTGGVGNSYAGLGASVEAFLVRSRVSAFGTLGYVPRVNDTDGRTAAGAGMRAYSGGVRHRVYLEGAFAPLIADERLASAPIPYGPALAVGYSYTAASGFTLTLSRGIGWAGSRHRLVAVGNFGLGYTWHR